MFKSVYISKILPWVFKAHGCKTKKIQMFLMLVNTVSMDDAKDLN